MRNRRAVRVVCDYEPLDREPLNLRTGDRVEVGRRDDTWPDFLWCSCPAGEGWVYEGYLAVEGSTATALRAYETTELTAVRGERLAIVGEAGGWVFCEGSGGRRGWIPAEYVEDG